MPTDDAKDDASQKDETQGTPSEFLTVSQFNSALTNRTKKLEKEIADLKAAISERLPPKDATQPGDPAAEASQPSISSVQAEVTKLRRENEAEKAKLRATELEATTRHELTQNGVAPAMLDAAMGLLINRRKLIVHDEEGRLVFKDIAGDITVTEGIATWARSQEGRAFLASKNAQGAGSTSISKDKTSDTGYNPEILGRAVYKQIRRA